MLRSLLAPVNGVALALVLAAPAAAATAPNGQIAYQCENAQYYFDICVVDPATGDVANLTDDMASDGFPSWSPDGKQIAFYSDYSIEVINADGTGRRTVTGSYANFAFSPAWSPDGTRIAFVSTRGGTDYEIWTVPATGETAESPATRLTTTPRDPQTNKGQNDFLPAWSPDSRRLVFVSQSRDVEDRCDIYAMDAVDADGDGNGDNLQRLTHDNAQNCSAYEDINPSWAPTGDLIAYSSTRSGNADIWVMNADGTGQRNLTNHGSWDWMPGWSPDGKQVTFTSARDGDEDIYALSLDAPPVAAAAARRRSGARKRVVARAAQSPILVQLTHNDTQDRMSDWGAGVAAPAAAPTTTVTRPEQGATYRRLGFDEIEGRASSDAGVKSVKVALRRRHADGSCRWWTGSKFEVGPCGERRWVEASGTTRWTYKLDQRLALTDDRIRSYTAFARAVDVNGRRTSKLETGTNANTFFIK